MIGDAAQYEKELAEAEAAREIIIDDDDPETQGAPSGWAAGVALLVIFVFAVSFHFWGPF